MPCPQDPELIQAGIAIDAFPVWASTVIISHAHGDHIRGIETNRPRGIVAHRITCELLKQRYPQHSYDPIDYYGGLCFLSGITVTLIPSIHIPGACMVLVDTPTKRVLYTSDFRFTDEYRSDRFLDLIHARPVSILYMDDTYARVSRRFPTVEDTRQTLAQLVAANPAVTTWAVSAKTIGIECVLSSMGQVVVDEGMPEWRKVQLAYLLPSEAKQSGPRFKLVWDSKKHPYQGKEPLIKCVTYPFIHRTDMVFPIGPAQFAVFYATHTNAEETSRFCSFVNPQMEISLCGDENE